MEQSKHPVLRFDVGIRREIARSLIQALQHRPEPPTHNSRPCISNRNREVTVVHAYAPKTLPIEALGESTNTSLHPELHAVVRFPHVEPNAGGEPRPKAEARNERKL
jgi:hypothetical protein